MPVTSLGPARNFQIPINDILIKSRVARDSKKIPFFNLTTFRRMEPRGVKAIRLRKRFMVSTH